MYDKLKITGEIEVVTGLHIGGSSQFSAIGAVDSPVIKDKVSNQPIIPGSSLKGKMRTLLAKYYSESNIVKEPNQDTKELLNLFGSSVKSKLSNNGNTKEKIVQGRLQFKDAQLSNIPELKEQLLDTAVEVKFENGIDRLTAEATPRQIERVIRKAKFHFEIMYDAWFEFEEDEQCIKRIEDDFEIIGDGMQLLQLDYLGGNGTRGYGKIEFGGLSVTHAFGESKMIDTDKLLSNLNEKIKTKVEGA